MSRGGKGNGRGKENIKRVVNGALSTETRRDHHRSEIRGRRYNEHRPGSMDHLLLRMGGILAAFPDGRQRIRADPGSRVTGSNLHTGRQDPEAAMMSCGSLGMAPDRGDASPRNASDVSGDCPLA